MIRIYEVRTENNGQLYDIYNVAAKGFAEAVAKVQKDHIDRYKHVNDGEVISEVKILAQED